VKNTYWIADTDGTKALVEGADKRDHWVKGRGWTETAEPEGYEFVWLRNDDPGLGPIRLNWQAAQDPAWAERGFKPGEPDEPINLALSPEHPLRIRAEAAAKAAATKSVPTSKSAATASGDKIKE
jgi:hypothetical protein